MFGISIPSLRGEKLIESALLVTLILFGCLFLYLALGLPLAFVLGGVGMIGCLILWGPSGFMIASSQGYAAMGKFTLISIPLFVLMAMLLERSGVAEDLYTMMHNWLGPLGGAWNSHSPQRDFHPLWHLDRGLHRWAVHGRNPPRVSSFWIVHYLYWYQ